MLRKRVVPGPPHTAAQGFRERAVLTARAWG